MSTARDIPSRSNGADGHRHRTVSNSFDAQNPSLSFHSTSPIMTMSPPSSLGRQPPRTALKALKPFYTGDIKVLLLENVNQIGQDLLRGQGYQVEAIKAALPEDQLIEKIKYVRVTTEGNMSGLILDPEMFMSSVSGQRRSLPPMSLSMLRT